MISTFISLGLGLAYFILWTSLSFFSGSFMLVYQFRGCIHSWTCRRRLPLCAWKSGYYERREGACLYKFELERDMFTCSYQIVGRHEFAT
ncbi:uncharacterized protein LOC141612465 isoform X4 [Silene latifolia]|uniref:uncharacterized protein LOC141612465 isoform X4 n=1 Tax=Silene latifolia TaxID=37657 RepID=UPI003D77337B